MQWVEHQKMNSNPLSLRLVKVSGLCWYLWCGRNEERRHVVPSLHYRYGWVELQSAITVAEFGKCEFRCSNSKSIGFLSLTFPGDSFFFIFKLYNIVYRWRIPGDSWRLLFVWFYPYLLPNHLDLIFKFSTFFEHFQTKTGISHHYNITLLTVIIWKKQRPI